ncbi:DNA recombinase [Microbacterium phage Quammi]|nr:RecA-like DNA recombinase [Microbacterium phage Casend]QQO39560.1 RecA-like DNA recombinase [Microbacterium phage Phabia]QWY80435.1 DNA recombinase [Microbacterium phage Teehee]QWY80536.1 DNA recombinase [Microbacterium phage Quammi]QXN73446.1 RecA-like DNA recombinase [Microbacterium phage Jehoshaphat]UVG34002.1 DNA recombinase [Microbacterium phage Wheelie]WNM75570.1 DNA recombinase [Microbacterium phage Wayne3]
MNQPAPYRLEAVQPPSHVRYAHSLGRGMLTFEQIAELVKPINAAYVQSKQSQSYLSQHQARAEMNRIFGYGNWSSHVREMQLMYEERLQRSDNHPSFPRNGKADVYWISGYATLVEVEIRDLWGMPITSFSEWHAEENAPQPNRGEARAMAMTSVESYALRRALIGLGDRLGLGLYNGGSKNAHGQYTIQQYEGQLGKWVPNEQEPQAQVPIVTHETIQAEPVISDDGTNPNWVDPTQQPAQAPVQQQMAPQQVQQQAPQVVQQAGAPQQQQQQQQAYVQQQGPTPQGDGTVQGIQQAAQQQAYARQQYTQQQFAVDPSMAARLQQGFKQDHPRLEEAEIAAWEGQG